MRKTLEPTVEEEYGDEVHPAFGLIGASRVSVSPPGSVLFDSDVKHGHTVIVRIRTAGRRRDNKYDWIHGREELIEVEMSEAQWASLVSSMNSGNGTPCTIRRREDGETTPSIPYAPRLAHSLDETRDAAHEAFDEIKEAMAAYELALLNKAPAAERNEALRTLRARISNAVPNVEYAGQRLVDHTEDVITKARYDVEAFVIAKAKQLGIEPGDVGSYPMLDA